jgi:hypothetical protein
MRDIPEPDFDDPKEVYAFFGLAMYNANLLEASLINLAVALNLDKSKVITREVFEATFGEMEAKTLGQLLKATQKLAAIPPELEPVLKSALETRNFLAHGFFRSNAEEFIHEGGKRIMIKELSSMIELFRQADELLTPVYMALWEKYGVNEEFIQQEMERAYAEAEKRHGGL